MWKCPLLEQYPAWRFSLLEYFRGGNVFIGNWSVFFVCMEIPFVEYFHVGTFIGIEQKATATGTGARNATNPS